MVQRKFSNNKITFRFGNASVSANGQLGKVIAWCFAGILAFVAITAIQNLQKLNANK